MDPLTIMAIANVATQVIGGTAELIRGGKSNRAAKGARADYEEQMGAIPLQDPAMVGLLGDTRRRRRAFEAGTDPMTSYTQQQIGAQGAQTQANAVRAGSRGVSDLLRVQAGTNRGLAESGARASAQANNLFAMEGELVGAMADRAYRRQMSDAQMAWNEYAWNRENAGRQTQAGLGMILGIGADIAGSMGGGGGNAGGVGKAMGGKSIDNSATPAIDYLNNSGYRSRKNYGFNYMAPSPNYGFNI